MVKKGYRDPPYHNWMHALLSPPLLLPALQEPELTNYLE